MKITIKGTNLQLSDSIYSYIQKKLESLEKLINVPTKAPIGKPAAEAWFEVEKTTDHQRKGEIFRAEIQIKLPGAEGIRSESTKWDLHQAIDEAKDEMQRQLKRYKNKQDAKNKRGARKAKDDTRYSESA